MNDKTSGQIFVVSDLIESTILEKHLTNNIPLNRRFSIAYFSKLFNFDISKIGQYVHSDLCSICQTKILITDNTELLSAKTLLYCQRLIEKYILPCKYKHNNFAYHIGKYFDKKYFSANEKNFINFALETIISIANTNITCKQYSIQPFLNFNSLNNNGFNQTAKEIYNKILQNKLHVGDNILPYLKKYSKSTLSKNCLKNLLKMSTTYDCFFDTLGFLKCDLNTNSNLFIKNFLNSIIYEFKDSCAKRILLAKLNYTYPFSPRIL